MDSFIPPFNPVNPVQGPQVIYNQGLRVDRIEKQPCPARFNPVQGKWLIINRLRDVGQGARVKYPLWTGRVYFLLTINTNGHTKTMTTQQREYRRFLRSVQWSVQRARIVVRSHGVCEVCRKSRVKQIHHLRYTDPIALTPDSDLVAICGRCHRNSHIASPQAAGSAEITLF